MSLIPIIDPPFPEWRALLGVACAWCLAQSLKVLRLTIRRRRFNLRWLFDTGGMPSSHSAGVASVATVTGLFYGFGSILFLMALSFAVVTMFDAAGVRRLVGKQAIVLNKMTDDLYEHGQIGESRLKELLGHTPIEVFAGAFLGILISYVICMW